MPDNRHRYQEETYERPRGILRRSASGRLEAARPPLVSESGEAPVAAPPAPAPIPPPVTAPEPPVAPPEPAPLPEPEASPSPLVPVPPVESPPAPQPPPVAKTIKQVELSIHLPHLRLPKFHPSKKAVVLGVAALTAGVVGVSGFAIWHSRHNQAQIALSSAGVQGAEIQTPNFTTVLPTGKTIKQLGGWGRVSPPNSAPAFAYSDMLDSIHITVSEQQLPTTLRTVGDVAQFANDLHAGAGGTVNGSTFYLSTAPNGAQSLIYTTHDLLILIRAAGQLSNQQWAGYLGSLH